MGDTFNPNIGIDDLFSGESKDRFKEKNMQTYEERIVKKLLTHVGLAHEINEIKRATKELTGQVSVSYAMFNDMHPDFPVALAIRQLSYVYEVSIKDLFNRFPSTQFFKTWADAVDEASDPDKPLGLVFDWPGVAGTHMIIHNNTQVNLDVNNVRIARRVGKGSTAQTVYVEQLTSFLDSVAQHWNNPGQVPQNSEGSDE